MVFDIPDTTWQQEEKKFAALWARGDRFPAVPALKLPDSADSRAASEAKSVANSRSTVRLVQPSHNPMTTPPKHKFSPPSDPEADAPEIVATTRTRTSKSSHSKKGAVRKLFKEDD